MPETLYPSSLPVGTRIDEYQLLSVLGQGSFGITYLAEDINLGARLAIKEYLPDDWAMRDSTLSVRAKSERVGASFARGQDEFLEEARLLARVSHPNIVKVRRFFRTHGTAYIAMDFIAGSSFGDVLDRDYPNGGYPSAALKRLLVAILDGLNVMHAAGIIHRDIKPGNIIIEPEGNPILVDFGAARRVTRAGKTVIVTHGYAPIEQYAEDGEQGPFTDLYALGALAHRAIIGRPPGQPYKRLGQDDALAANPDIAGHYPPALLAAIDWALAVQPQDRPRDASALLVRLAEVTDEVPLFSDDRTVVLNAETRRFGSRAGSTRLGTPSSSTRVMRADRQRRPVPWKLIIAAIVLLLLAGGGTAAYLEAPGMVQSVEGTLGAVPSGIGALPGKVRGIIALPGSSDSDDTDAAARKAAAAAESEHLQEAPESPTAIAPPPPQPAPANKAKARQEAAAAAAAARAERDAAAKAERDAAAAAAAAKQPTKAPSSAPAHTADPRCTSILQNAQVTGGLTDADRTYLREHCH